MSRIIPLLSGRGLCFSEAFKNMRIEDDTLKFEVERDEKAFKSGILCAVLQDDGSIYPGIAEEGNNAVFVCGCFQVQDANSGLWVELDLTDLPHRIDDLREWAAKGVATCKTVPRRDV